MEHGIGVDAVVARLTTAVGIDPTTEVRLLTQEVVEVKGNDERFVAKETFRHLAVPYQLVGVLRGVVVASAGVHVHVGGDLEVERQSQKHLSAVVELPGIDIGTGLQFIARVLVVAPAIEHHLKPIVTEAGCQSLRQVGGARIVLLRVLARLGIEAHIIIITQARVRTYIKMSRRVEGGAKVEAAIHIPVTVDILRSGDASTSLRVITHEIRDGVAGIGIVGIDDNRPLVTLDVVVVIHIQRIGELGFQSRITLGDIERIGVVGDVEQLRDVRLPGITAVVEPDILLVRKLVVEVERRRDIRHVADSVDVDATVVLDVIGVLRLHKHAHVVVVFLLPVAEHETDVVGVVLVL